MAFVFSTQRWKEEPANDWVPGPGTYTHEENCMEESTQFKKIYRGKAFPKTPTSNENSLQCLSIKNKQERTHKLIKEKKRPYFQPWKSIPNKKQHLMTVKSFVPRQFNQRPTTKTPKPYKLDIEPTNPSIKNSIPSNFYVGPADNKLSGKIIHSQPQSQKMRKNQRSKLGEQIKNNWLEEEDEASFYGELFKEVKYTLRRKTATANHPFRKRNLQSKQKHQNISETQLPTRISDEDSFGSQTDTPGPGYYDIQKKPQTTKKSMMFTQHKQRFNGIYPCKGTGTSQNQPFVLNKQRNKSRACQSRVGFGRSLTSKTNQVISKDVNFKFYEDNQTIESKALLHKINDEIKPGCFNLTRDYVQQKRKEEISKEYFDAIEKNKAIVDKYELSKNKITYQFKSKAERENKSNNDSVDYSGQQYKTIQDNLDRVQEQQEDKEEKLYFDSSEKRFIYPEHLNSGLKTQLEIKHGLVPDFNGFRQRPLKKSLRQIPAYTFKKQNTKENNENSSPAPDHYSQQISWVQKTYNKKFMPR